MSPKRVLIFHGYKNKRIIDRVEYLIRTNTYEYLPAWPIIVWIGVR